MSANINVDSRRNLPYRQPPTLLAYIAVPLVIVLAVGFLSWLVFG